MRFKDLANLSPQQLAQKQAELELELMKERAAISSGTAPKNPGMIKESRRTIARIKQLQSGGSQ